MARKVFISILGTGMYEKCVYQANAGKEDEFLSDEVRFIQEATLDCIAKDWGKDDKALILLTDRARKENWDKDLTKRINYKKEEIPYEGLEKKIEGKKIYFSNHFLFYSRWKK